MKLLRGCKSLRVTPQLLCSAVSVQAMYGRACSLKSSWSCTMSKGVCSTLDMDQQEQVVYNRRGRGVSGSLSRHRSTIAYLLLFQLPTWCAWYHLSMENGLLYCWSHGLFGCPGHGGTGARIFVLSNRSHLSPPSRQCSGQHSLRSVLCACCHCSVDCLLAGAHQMPGLLRSA